MEKYTIDRLYNVNMSIIPNDLYTKNPRSFKNKIDNYYNTPKK